MADKQYDVSEDFLKLFHKKQQQRKETKAYFQRLVENPHRPIGDGEPFDPVLNRFHTLGSYKIEHFRPNPRNVFQLFAILIIPIFGLAGAIRHFRLKNDRMYRYGKVAYKDRLCRLL